ncbi:LemA family protein [Aerococcus kribbianus]|uniref:LemA family protein n=1 Tax=Aerococcus kribbianus TaxID=2999064 RepID=A0A9X3JFG1_9LACT|nr:MULTISPECIES: LemA family protein [unclassified Aerococcus]MCZ0717052.1 LemA family protein [Aerococcus sp. YH-aer221]MCZ0725340.1 LemA family protein [Aerococcus sp. YH-aer222]
MNIGWIIAIVIVVLIVGLVVWGIKLYNQMIGSQEMVTNAMAQIAAQVESRWDALTNLIQATTKYQSHESETLTTIVKHRSGVDKNSSVKDVEKDDQAFAKAMRAIDVVVEQYPDLKAANVYQSTMNSVNDYENNVRQARMIFNDTVTKYNRLIKTFPNSIVAGITGFKASDYFEASVEKQEMPQW